MIARTGRRIDRTNSTAVPLKFLLLAHARHPALPPLLFSAAKASKGKAASLSLSFRLSEACIPIPVHVTALPFRKQPRGQQASFLLVGIGICMERGHARALRGCRLAPLNLGSQSCIFCTAAGVCTCIILFLLVCSAWHS